VLRVIRKVADFYYTGAGRGQTLEIMRDRFLSNPGLVLLVDEKGSGRTTFLHALINSFPVNESDACLLSENCIRLETEEELFQSLADGFRLEHKPVEILEELKSVSAGSACIDIDETDAGAAMGHIAVPLPETEVSEEHYKIIFMPAPDIFLKASIFPSEAFVK